MRWSSRNPVRSRGPNLPVALPWLLLLAIPIAFFYAHSAEDKRLSVYAPQAIYSVKVIDRGAEYVDVYTLIQPLAKPEVKLDAQQATLKVNNIEGHFTNGSDKAKIGMDYVTLDAAAIIQGDKDRRTLLIPMDSIPQVLSRYMKMQMDFHVTARRLFIDNTASLFTAVRKADDGSLVLSFPSRVEPHITVEGAKLRMVFARDPIVSGTDNVAYDDKLFSSLAYAESNGSAEITVTGKSPLLASFADQGRSIVISAAPKGQQPVVQAPAVPAPQSAVSTSAVDAPTPLVPQPQSKPRANPLTALLAAATPKYFVMIDASHGGAETGTRFSGTSLEKDVTLELARGLRSELESRGVPSVLLRDGDATLSLEQRALAANMQRASLYVSIHATVSDPGVHVYTAFLPTPTDVQQRNRTSFLPWERANAPYAERSKVLANALVAELGSKKIKAVTKMAPVPPLNNIAAPAVVMEVGAGDGEISSLTNPGYKAAVTQAAAAAIVGMRTKMEETPLR
jgi:N-acetylmuramoyl-L-alanine amidase